MVDQIQLKLHDNKINQVKKPKILIAGCGTGQHSIETAARFKSSKVLAIDLSLSSLAYAKRKTDKLGIKNIDYMQADILDLAKLNKHFDIIESSGVFTSYGKSNGRMESAHRLPKTSGLMSIALYSEFARQNVVKIKNEINQQGIGTSNAAIKIFRNMIIKSSKDHHKLVTTTGDFYSLSSLKDLLFHVQEHRFTIPQIKDYLDKLGLKFVALRQRK